MSLMETVPSRTASGVCVPGPELKKGRILDFMVCCHRLDLSSLLNREPTFLFLHWVLHVT